jgi:hypothetical protein
MDHALTARCGVCSEYLAQYVALGAKFSVLGTKCAVPVSSTSGLVLEYLTLNGGKMCRQDPRSAEIGRELP